METGINCSGSQNVAVVSCPNAPTVGHPYRYAEVDSRKTCPHGGGETCGNDKITTNNFFATNSAPLQKSGQTGGFGGVLPVPPVLSQISRRAFPLDYKPIALRVGLQFAGRTLLEVIILVLG
jgi:hypothetical protein